MTPPSRRFMGFTIIPPSPPVHSKFIQRRTFCRPSDKRVCVEAFLGQASCVPCRASTTAHNSGGVATTGQYKKESGQKKIRSTGIIRSPIFTRRAEHAKCMFYAVSKFGKVAGPDDLQIDECPHSISGRRGGVGRGMDRQGFSRTFLIMCFFLHPAERGEESEELLQRSQHQSLLAW